MKRIALALLATALAAGTAGAAPPTAEQKAEFYRICTQRGAADLCSCKADAAMKLVDSEFMAVIITAMSGGSYPRKYDVPYNDYIAESTRACGMGM